MQFILFILMILTYIPAGNYTSASKEPFGSCNYTEFVAEAVGLCEKRFYMELANDPTVDCCTAHARISPCFVKKTRQCLAGHYNEEQIEKAVNITVLVLRITGSSQWYCFNKPTNTTSLDPSLRQGIPCTDELFTEGHKCTKGFREIFNSDRGDPRLCKEFSRARSCTQSVFDRYCNPTIPVPTENRFNPFCNDLGNDTTVEFQASTKPKNATKTVNKPRKPETNGAYRNVKLLSRMLSVTVGVVNLTNVVRSLRLD